MATVIDKSGNSPAKKAEDHIKSKQEIIIADLDAIKTNTAA